MNGSIEVEEVRNIDAEIIESLERLIPQLSSSTSVPTAGELSEIADSPCTALLIARDRNRDRQIVGSLTLAVFRIPTGMRAWIEDVVVDSDARGQGVGEALNREALRIATSRGARTVELTSRPSREAANRLYQRLGFEIRQTNLYRYSLPEGGKIP